MAFGASAVGAIAVGVAAFLLIGPSTRVMDVVRRRRSPSTAQARSVSSWRGRVDGIKHTRLTGSVPAQGR